MQYIFVQIVTDVLNFLMYVWINLSEKNKTKKKNAWKLFGIFRGTSWLSNYKKADPFLIVYSSQFNVEKSWHTPYIKKQQNLTRLIISLGCNDGPL